MRVDLITRSVKDENIEVCYVPPVEKIGEGVKIVRITAGPDGSLPKKLLWDHLDTMLDNIVAYWQAD